MIRFRKELEAAAAPEKAKGPATAESENKAVVPEVSSKKADSAGAQRRRKRRTDEADRLL
jgi:hypothetical protein